MARNELYCYFRNNLSLGRDGNFLYINEKLPNDILRRLIIFFNNKDNTADVTYTVYMGEHKIVDTMLIAMGHKVELMDNSGARDGFDAIICLTFRSADNVESFVFVDLFYKSMDDAKKDLEIIKSLLGEDK